jgi:hypothetical protein
MELLKEKKIVTRTTFREWKLSKSVMVREIIQEKRKPIISLHYIGAKLKWKSSFDKKKIDTVQPVLVKPEFFEFCKISSPWWENVEFKGKRHRWIFDELIIREPKTIEEVKLENIVFLYGNNHLVFSGDEKILPTPFWGNYIGNGHFDSDHYDLEPLLEHLKKHPAVLKETPGIESLKILDVPYYNNESGTKKYINVLVLPDAKELNKIYDRVVKEKLGKYNSWSTALKDEVLGTGYSKNENDFLKINKFLKPKNEQQ